MAVAGNTITVRVLGDASGLATTLASVETTAGASLGKLGTSAEGAGKKVAEVEGSATKATGGLASLAKGAGTMIGAFAGFEIIKGVSEHFNAAEEATSRLTAAMKAAGESTGPKFEEALSASEHAGVKLGFTVDETANSLEKLRLAGVDTAKGMEIQSQIADLARAKNITLADATEAVVKGMQGQGKALKDLNIELPPHLATTAQLDAANAKVATGLTNVTAASDKYTAAIKAYGPNSTQATAAGIALAKANETLAQDQANATEITGKLSDRTSQLGDILETVHGKTAGQAAAATETLSGKMEVLKAQFFETADKIASALMPVFNDLLAGLGFLADHIDIVLPALGVLLTAFTAFKMLEGINALLKMFNLTLISNPIVLIVVAVVALIAIFVALELKFHFIEAGFKAVGDAAQVVWNWIKNNWPVLLEVLLGPFGVILFVATHFSEITGTIGTVIDWVKAHWPLLLAILTGPFGLAILFVSTHFSEIVGAITGVFDTIKGFFAGLLTSFYNFGRNIIQKIIDGIGSMAGALKSKAGDVIGGAIHDIPGVGGALSMVGLASGGPFTAGQSLLVGEQGPERLMFGAAGTVVPNGQGGGDTYHQNVNVYGNNLNPSEIAAEMAWLSRTRGT